MTINWEQIVYDYSKATTDLEMLDFSRVESNMSLPNSFHNLREQLIEARDEIFDSKDFDKVEKLSYEFDLEFGLKLYEILNLGFDFTNRVASNDTIWRYLSIKVIPDIVHSRWGLNNVRYLTSRRIWLKNIWWYIHLSWAGSVRETYEILKDNNTDTVMQLVERPGLGYYTDLYREIMRQYASRGNKNRLLFRNVLKLNTALLPMTYPELMDGGIEQYVSYLFNKSG
mgnify:CR=1 FL=1